MPLVASYIPVQDQDFTISTSGDRDRDVPFTVPVEHLAAPDLLQWRVQTSGANDLRFRVELNVSPDDTATYTYGPSDENLTRDFLEIVNTARDGANNIRFNIIGGSGSVRISDIVLWYRLNV